MESLLQALRAAGEQTRLRILALCAERELTVTDLIQILGQTQSRVSRHLKILVEAGLLERYQEGQWARYRVAGQGSSGPIRRNGSREGVSVARYVMQHLDTMNPILRRDRETLRKRQGARQQEINRYFSEFAPDWEKLRSTHIDQDAVDNGIRDMLLSRPVRHLLDAGTGAAHALEVLGPHVGAAIGVDNSFAMLDIARNRIEEAGLSNCQVRHGDLMALPYEDGTFDAALFNMVLHYFDNPETAIEEVARVTETGGQILVVDFAAHDRKEMQTDFNHAWLGFDAGTLTKWLEGAGYRDITVRDLNGPALQVLAVHGVRT